MASSSEAMGNLDALVETLKSQGMTESKIAATLAALAEQTEKPQEVPPVSAKSAVKESSAEEDDEVVLTKRVKSVSARAERSVKRRTTTVLPGESSRAKKGKGIASSTPKRVTRTTRKLAAEIEEVGSEDENVEEEQNVDGKEVISQRSIIPELVLNFDWLVERKLEEVVEILKAQKWDKLFQSHVMINEDQMKEFYSSLRVKELPGRMSAVFEIDGEELVFNSNKVAQWLDVEHEGYAEYSKRLWPEDVSRKEVKDRVGPNTASMMIVNRVLHRILVQNLCPRLQKHEQLLIHDYMILDCLIQRKQVSLPRQIMHHMSHVNANPTHGLPYPGLVKRILQENGVYKAVNEVSASKDFDDANCVRIGFTFDKKEGWSKEGTYAPTGKEVVAGADYKLEFKKMLTVVEGKVSVLTKTINTLMGGVTDKMTGMELDAKAERTEICERITRIESDLKELKKQMSEHDSRVEDDIGTLREQLISVGTEIVQHLEEVFLAANLENQSVPPKP